MTLLLVPLARRVNNFSSVCNGNINSHGNIVYSVNTMRAETRKSGCVFKKIVGIVSRVNTVGVSKMR